MKTGRCIYCRQKTDLNTEHAFPQSLRQSNTPEWIIDNHLCKKCNSDFGDIDMVLAQRSIVGFLFDIIQREHGQEKKNVYASPYHKPASGVNPIRMLFPNSIYDDLIVNLRLLHKACHVDLHKRLSRKEMAGTVKTQRLDYINAKCYEC